MVDCYIGLGSNMSGNMGVPAEHLQAAVQDLGQLPQTRLVACSSFYRTKPIGPLRQADFINAAARLDSALAPAALLARLQGIEARHGRLRNGRRWRPRPLDLDLLLYGQLQISTPALTVPHGELSRRAFALAPLAELNARLVVPGLGPVAALLAAVGLGGVRKITEDEATQGRAQDLDRRGYHSADDSGANEAAGKCHEKY